MIRKSIKSAVLSAIVVFLVGAEVSGISAYGQPALGNGKDETHNPVVPAQSSGTPAASAPVQPMFGAIAGVVKSSAKVPIAGAMVTAARADGKGIWTTISGSDGIYSISNVAPGEYLVTSQAEGYPDTSIATLQIAAGRATRTDVMMAANGSPQPAVITAKASAPSANVAAAPAALVHDSSTQNVWVRLFKPAPSRDATARQPQTTPAATVASLRIPPIAAFGMPATNSPAADVGVPFPMPQGAPAPAPAPAVPAVPEALQAPDAGPAVDNDTPYAFGDFTWLNGNPRNKDPVFDTKFFTPDIRVDTYFSQSFNQPKDHTMAGSTEEFRSGEFQVEQISFGGDFHWQNVRGRILTMFGMFSTTTPRNDASPANGQWDLRDAYRYVSEAWGGYHFNVNHGLNVDAGIFVSYIGLFSYYNYDNWTYQPSYVSSNTPWFFNGLRIQWFPTNKLKIEPWIINGWQSYARANGHHGFGGQILYRPQEWLSMVFNNYGDGTDALGVPNRVRIHTDDSIEVRYFNKPGSIGLSKAAFSFTGDLGCEYGKGSGVSCTGKGAPKQAFLGWMAYDRYWFHKDLVAVTLGGGMMNNPGRYLTLLPPINGADAISGSPYFTENPGDKAHMWDTTFNVQYMPKQYITWWAEFGYRHSDIPYFSGRGGITPPGGNNGVPTQYVCSTGAASGTSDLSTAYANCGGSVWFPDLRHGQASISAGVLVKF